MKWIKFDDMKPPIGMHILARFSFQFTILKWLKDFNIDDTIEIMVFTDGYSQEIEVGELNYWMPISFLDEYVPQRFTLPYEFNWYDQHKDHANLKTIKEIIVDLNNKTEAELNEFIKDRYGIGKKYIKVQLWAIEELFDEIRDPIRYRRKTDYEVARDKEAMEFYGSHDQIKQKDINEVD